MYLKTLIVASVAALLGPVAPVVALYAYAPDALVVSADVPALPDIIRNPGDADVVLDSLEASFGVQASDDPALASRPDLNRVYRTERVMERHWQRLDAECDPNAVFALMYLTTTHGIRFHIEQDYFADNDYLSVITVSFAKMYLDAYAAWERGDLEESPEPWRKAFAYAITGQSSIMEDEFLGMNAHINYDLAIAIAGLGTASADGTSRKPDMDRVNHVLADVTDDVGYDIARYYGPAPLATEPNRGEGHESTPETMAVLEGIYLWREHAWNNAVTRESLSGAERDAHESFIETAAGAATGAFMSPKAESPQPARLAYCMANP